MSFEPSKVPTDARGVANTLLTRIKRVLLMDAGAAVDRILGPYARWLVAHPVLAAVPNLLLGGVFVVIGWLVIHSTYFVIVGLVGIGAATLSLAARLVVALAKRGRP